MPNFLEACIKKTCFKSRDAALLDVMLTNKPKGFQSGFVAEAGLGDCVIS